MDIFILRFMLAAYGTVAFIISVFYLGYRRVTFGEYVFWGIVAFLLPVVGPFFVIAARPGPRKRLHQSQASRKPQANKS
jgi:hypothetical protein